MRVCDPQGREWHVRRQRVYRDPPRLRGRRWRDRDLSFDGVDLGGDDLLGGVVVVVVGLLVGLLLTLLVVLLLPVLLFLAEIVLLVLLVGTGVLGRLLHLRPWTVQARGPGRVVWATATGWLASRRAVRALAADIASGAQPAR